MISLHGALDGKDKSSIADVAVFAEGESLYHVRKNSDLTTFSLLKMHRTLAELGAPYDLYSVQDIMTCPADKYRLIIMLDAYDIKDEVMKRIRALQAAGVAVLWMYAPNYAKGERNSAEQISDAVCMHVSVSDTPHGGYVYGGRVTDSGLAAPYPFIDSADALPLCFFEDGKTAVAMTKDAMSFYAAAPFIRSDLLRDILRKKGVFIYSGDPYVYTYVNADAICVYNATAGDALIRVPTDGAYRDEISGEVFTSKDGMLTLAKRELDAFLLTRLD